MSPPLVAIVGRPNVGKSTLFNRLVGKRVAIVEDTPGITRDRLYASANWNGRDFFVVDTGGILMDTDDPLTEQVRLQAEIAIEEANVIIFMVDAKDGLTPTDIDVADRLRGSDRPVLLAANKVDNSQLAMDAVEFHSLGLGELYTVSSLHGHGVADLLDSIVSHFEPEPASSDLEDDILKLAIIGRPNVGKSSLLNAILGSERAIVSPIPGTTRDAVDTLVTYNDRPIVLIDTAGIRRAGQIQGSVEYYTFLRAQSAIERCDIALLVTDASEFLTDGDKRAGGLAHDMGRGCVVVVNKWDRVDPGITYGKPPNRRLILEFTDAKRKQCGFLHYAPLVFVSAAQCFSIREVLDTALSAAEFFHLRIPTGELNRLISLAEEDHPLMEHGRAFHIYYATMPAVKPPTVLLFVNDPDHLHFSYRRYLENRIRGAYGYEGTPIVIKARRAGAETQGGGAGRSGRSAKNE